MKNLEYEPWTSKYSIVFPILVVISWFILFFYRINYLWLDWLSAFLNIDFYVISPLILIFWWIILFFIIYWAQSWENKMDKLNVKDRQKELRNKIIKDFRLVEIREKKHMYFYILVWLFFLTAYVLIITYDHGYIFTLILFWILWVLVPLVQWIKLYKYVNYKKLRNLKEFGKCIEWNIIEIKEKWKWFLRDDTMRYQIIAKSKETWDKIFKSKIVRFDLQYFLEKWDKINIYIENGNHNRYFVDIESAFLFWEK